MKAEIYTTAYCPYCHRAKELLTRLEIDYTETVLEFDTPEMDELIERTGHQTVPQIFLAGRFIGGYDELKAEFAPPAR